MRRDRYRRAQLQRAYEAGYTQMYDHDSCAFTDRMYSVAKQESPARTAEAMAAMYEGGDDALRRLAALSRESGRRAGSGPCIG